MKKLLFAILMLMIIGFPLLAQEQVTKVGTTAAGFLNIDVGAKAISMGSAYVAVANDATAMYWNPAGISQLTNSQAIFTYNNWIADLDFNYVGIAVPVVGFGSIGVNATFLTMGDMERTTIDQPDGNGEKFSAGSYAFGLAYARALTDRFSIGTNIKYIHEYIYHCSASGFAFDIGTQFITRFNDMKIGMSIANFGTKMQLDGRDLLVQFDSNPIISGNNENINALLKTEKYDLPLLFRVGVSMDVLKGAGDSNLIIAADALHPNDDVEFMNVGAMYLFHNMFSLSAGYKTLFAEDSEEGFSFGAGFYYNVIGNAKLQFNYAFQDFGVLKDIQQFSIGLEF